MSDVLRGQIPELEEEVNDAELAAELDEASQQHIVVVIQYCHDENESKVETVVGIFKGIHVNEKPEVELRADVTTAFEILERRQLVRFLNFEVHHGEKTVFTLKGPYRPIAVRVDEINVVDQICTLGLHLERS